MLTHAQYLRVNTEWKYKICTYFLSINVVESKWIITSIFSNNGTLKMQQHKAYNVALVVHSGGIDFNLQHQYIE